MSLVLVTGGTGYIGSHTIVDLQQNGFEVICIDNLSRSSAESLVNVEKITGKKVTHYPIDLCNLTDVQNVFKQHPNIAGIIHFAAFKAVGESVQEPLMYYQNNLTSLLNLLQCVQEYKVPNFVFSSSCTVYGEPDVKQVTEQTPMKPAASPYGATKQMGENILRDFSAVNPTATILLRYFNPVGAHPSVLIGENTIGRPQNLVPAITQTAIGKLPQMQVFGNDYPTRDGSCMRDFIHVCDIAHAHTLALQYLIKNNPTNAKTCEPLNLGTGNGVTVLEAINAFEKVSQLKLNYAIAGRREGDIIAIYANNSLAKEKLGWDPKYGIEDMMKTAWDWEVKNAQ